MAAPGGADAEQDGQTGAAGVIESGIVMGVPAQH